MKFTCDNCSAQYMIADDKIGARGVKVRCKKCSHVIVLKPASIAAPPPSAPEADTGSVSLPPPASPFSLDVDAPSATASAFELPRTSSDMGLSAEFSAAGFEDTQSSVVRPSHTNLRDELLSAGEGPWGEDAPPPPLPEGSLSPFAAMGTGGSLSDFTDEAPNTELSAFPEFGTPGLRQDLRERDEEPSETTQMDSSPDSVALAFGVAGARTDSAASSLEAETRVAAVDIPPDAIPGFSDDPTSESSEDELRASSAKVELPAFDFGRALEDSLGDEETVAQSGSESFSIPVSAPPPPVPKSSAPPSALLESASSPLAGLPSAPVPAGDEQDDLGAALGGALGGASNLGWTPEDGLGDLDVGDFDLGGRPGAKRSSKPASLPAEAPVQHQESTAVGVTMAEAAENEDAAIIASHMAGMSKEHLDAELGSALDAVFGDEAENPQPSSTGPDPFASLVASAKGALVSTGIAPEEDRKETRVFDNEAMLRVQDEQVRAFGVREPEAEAVKEWYVGIEDEQVGPISFLEFQNHWDEARVDANSLCWRQGMGDWTAIRFVEELSALLDRPQTKKAKASDRPVTMAVASTGAERAEPMAARAFSSLGGGGLSVGSAGADAGDASDWRPNAASALASLAAAELDVPKANDIQVGPVLPVKKTASGSFESLIQPPTRSASLFGAQEETSSSMSSVVTRAPELVSPVPMAAARTRSSVPAWLPPTLAVFIGFVLLGGVLMWKLSPGPAAPTADSAASPSPELAQAGLSPATGAPVAPTEIPPPAEAAPAPSEAAPAPTPAPEPEAAAAPVEAAERGEDEGESAKSESRKKSKKERSSAGSTSKRKPKREREAEYEPPPPPPPTRARSTAEDLLESAGGSRRGASEEPARSTLDESDIFRVLKNNRSAILGCVEAQRKADPSVEGVMTVKFVIQGSGKTSGHSVGPSKFAGSKVGKCVISSVKKWSFPTFTGRAIPLDFPVKVTGG